MSDDALIEAMANAYDDAADPLQPFSADRIGLKAALAVARPTIEAPLRAKLDGYKKDANEFLVRLDDLNALRAEVEKLRAALNDIEAYVEGRVIAHRDIAELAESSMSGKKQRVRASEASDILGKIRAAAAALKNIDNDPVIVPERS